MRVILVPVADRPECLYALDAAFRLAAAHEANVVGCHVRPHRSDKAKFNPAAASRLFRRVAETNRFEWSRRPRLGRSGLAIWREMVGTPNRVLGIVGPLADLAVLSRPEIGRFGPAHEFLLAALLNTARPVLVLPQRRRVARLGRRILIAWSQRPETALAVTAALPLLRSAEQVEIVASGAQDLAGPKAAQLREYLTHCGVRSHVIRTRGRNVRKEIARAFVMTESDLLVMGAYSRNRLRERIFGGVTETLLFRSQLPVFAYHI